MTGNCWRLLVFLLIGVCCVRADQIEMQNGDRFSGTVVSMTLDTIVLQSEVLGQLKVPRAKVSTISFGSVNSTVRPAVSTNVPAPANPTAPLQQLGADTNLVQQIRKQFLADAGPQANDKFDELLNGLMTGKMDINGLRAEAKSAADQLRAMKKDMGGDAGQTLDAYLSVLDNFLAQSGPVAAPATNKAQGGIIIR